ncbi:unnamed protein product [Soboliphyme baturini]|uniref:Cohesin loading complex subunit SCC4 homolog n=1 Tax=Soboliphyme baturini TaxID=241478 RepID=A0A183IV17_9BILA|nr:unnamed protein product [Soboliphyme baturini]
MNCSTATETQFNSALRLARDAQLWTFVNLNLALLYLRDGRESDFYGLADRVNPESVQNFSSCLRPAACFLKGLHLFMQSRLSESKTNILYSKQDTSFLFRLLTACLFYVNVPFQEGFEETVKVMNAASQIARSVPDMECQLWASSLLKDIDLYLDVNYAFDLEFTCPSTNPSM